MGPRTFRSWVQMTIDAWLNALQERHRAGMTRPEFLKAVRALSARYVERRSTLHDRSPLDSAGKRAAFAAFYSPLHFLTTREIVRALGAPDLKVQGSIRRIVDLGCGTGVASAAWALEEQAQPTLIGVDGNAWALGEARWNWRQLGLNGETHRMDLSRAVERLTSGRQRSLTDTAVVAAWSVNELAGPTRDRLLPLLLECIGRGAAVLVIEPVAGSATQWWGEWEKAFTAQARGGSSRWRFAITLPEVLEQVSADAGFRRDALAAKSLHTNRASRQSYGYAAP